MMISTKSPKGTCQNLSIFERAQKPISDARIATYVILSIGSGPGGRWFKSIRPDQPSQGPSAKLGLRDFTDCASFVVR
jgi:hypothetical protein